LTNLSSISEPMLPLSCYPFWTKPPGGWE